MAHSCIYFSPDDSSPLTPSADGSQLRSITGKTYPIVGGIPRFCESGYASAFGKQWTTFATTQLDCYSGTSLSRDRLRSALSGRLDLLKGKRVLEVGAGAGRFTEIIAEYADELYTTDMSHAIDANYGNNKRFQNVCFAQANLYELPFPDSYFDVGVMLGVVQHTPDPLQAMRALAAKVRPRGHLCTDFYRLRLSFITRFGLHFARYVLRQNKHPNQTFRAVTTLFNRFDPLHRRYARSIFPYLLITRLSPIVSYYHRRLGLSEQQMHQWGYLDTHDQLTDRHKHLFTEGRIRRYCREIGLDIVMLKRAGNGFELLARNGERSPDSYPILKDP